MLEQLKQELESFPEESKVWVYQSNATLPSEHRLALQKALEQFSQQWTAHNNSLKAKALLLWDRFIVFVVDETQAGVSGCSIDKSVHFIQNIQSQLSVDFMDRMNWAYLDAAQNLLSLNKDQFCQAVQEGVINKDNLVFNNLVKNKAELLENWLIPMKDSWHMNFV